jgi:endonuclease G
MKKLIYNILIWILGITAMSCSAKLSSVPQRSPEQLNSHLTYEQDLIEDFVVYRGFVVQFNPEKKVPNYTIHRIVPQQLKDSSGVKAVRSNDFTVDDRISKHSATRSDYYRSGYDRGHLVPAGDFVYSQALKDETFIYTNTSPQLKELNRYGWKYLEAAIRRRVRRCNCEAYVITGNHFKAEHKSIGENNVGVPNQLYKIVFYPKQAKMYAFLMDNDTDQYLGALRLYQLSVDELEALLQLDFFEGLQDEDENRLELEFKKFRG